MDFKGSFAHLLKGNDVLLVVLLLVDDDVAVHEEVVEEVELSRLRLLAAHLGEDALADEDTARDAQGLPGAAETGLDQRNAPGVGFAVHCKSIEALLRHCEVLRHC